MKTKKLFLMAAMLLMSVCSFAQNNTPLKGDVNEDGQVDVADIVAVINIMKNGGGTTDGNLYFYVGTEKPTSLSQATVVDSYPAEYTFTNPSTTEKCYVYVLTNADKTVNFYDPSDPNTPTVKTEDTSTISGYKITSTGGRIAKGGDILIKITEAPMYYWYVGHNESDTYITNSNYTSIASQVTTLPASTDITPTDTYVYVVAPKTVTIRVYDPATNFDINMKTFNSSTGTYTNAETEVGDYKLYRSAQLVVGTTRITAQ